MNKALSPYTRILAFCLLASVASLGAAYTSQYGFGLKPCHLCLYQRVPFGLVIVLSLVAFFLKAQQRKWVVAIIGLAFLVNSGIASYHTAVEKHWIQGPTDCTMGEAPANQSMEEFLNRIKQAPIVACDQPQWEFHGITMAGMNAVWCLLLSVITFKALCRTRGKDGSHAPVAG